MALVTEEVEAILRLRDELTDKLQKAEGGLSSFGAAATRVGAGLTAAVTLPILGVGAASLKMAMDAEETKNLFDVSFGDMAAKADAWSKTTSAGLITTQTELRASSATLYTMMESMGLSKDAAFGMATSMIDLSADMASFRNLKPEEAFEKLRAGITGQTEPLMALGINVQEATIKMTAMKHGLISQGEEMTAQQKVMARYLAIMDQTKKDQGDLVRTQDSTTNQLKAMKKEMMETAEQLGQSLLPAFRQFLEIVKQGVPYIKAMVDWFSALSPNMQLVVIGAVGLLAALGPLLVLFGTAAASLTAVAAVFGTTAAVIASFIGIGALLVAGVASWVYVFQNLDVIVWAVKAVYDGVKTWLVDKFDALTAPIRKGVEKISDAFTWLKDTLVGHSTVPDMVDLIHGEFDRMGGGMDEKSKKAAAKVAQNMKELYQDVAKMEGEFASAAVVVGNQLDHTAVLWNKNRDLVHENAAAFRELSFEINATPKTVIDDLFDPASVREFNKELTALQELYAWIDEKNRGFANNEGLKQMAKDAGVSIEELSGKSKSGFEQIKAGAMGSLGDLNRIFQSAFEGGGGIGGAVKSMATNVVSTLTNMIPVVGPIISQFSGAIVAGLSKLGGLFGIGKSEGRQQLDQANADIQKIQASLLGLHGSLDRIREIGGAAGQALADAWGSQNVEGLAWFQERVAAFNAELERQQAIAGMVSSFLGEELFVKYDNLIAAWGQLTPEQQSSTQVVARVVAEYKRLRDELGIVNPELEELARNFDANALATDNARRALDVTNGTFVGLTGTIDILQARLGNTESINRMREELDKARQGGVYSFQSMLSEFERLKGSLGAGHPIIQQLEALLVSAATTGRFEWERFGAAFAALAAEMRAGINIPVTVAGPQGGGAAGGGRFPGRSFEEWYPGWIAAHPGDQARARTAYGEPNEFATGSSFIRQTGLAIIHEGEKITPAKGDPWNPGEEGAGMDQVLDKLSEIAAQLRTFPTAVASAVVLR